MFFSAVSEIYKKKGSDGSAKARVPGWTLAWWPWRCKIRGYLWTEEMKTKRTGTKEFVYTSIFNQRDKKKRFFTIVYVWNGIGFPGHCLLFFFFFFKKKYAKSPSGSFPLVAEAAATSHIDPLSYCHGASLTISARVGYKSLCTQTRNHTFFIGWLLWHLKFPWVETCK